MPRFVVLRHDHPVLHWDLMLEGDGGLWTWRLAEEPTRKRLAQGPVAAERIADHRAAYLDYEGPVSGGRGSVTRFDQGTFSHLTSSETPLKLHLEGQHLRGDYLLDDALQVLALASE